MMREMHGTMSNELAEATETERVAIQDSTALVATKTRSVKSLSSSIEMEIARAGNLAVEIAREEDDLTDTREALAEDQKFLAELQKTCEERKNEWEERSKIRAEELKALQQTVKILSDDDALEIFKKALPSPASSFVQVTVSAQDLRRRALTSLSAVSRHLVDHANMDFLALAIRGDKGGFKKVQHMIDNMAENLAKTQASDDKKNAWCNEKLSAAADKKAEFERSLGDTGSEVEE
eukprot:NODE_13098_length_1185_cov_3.969754.p1 GENE.NODE_13098_length_1185_cov_3.969754~~NODE_13098_length_1185_cov_3.969754.p1  ORF type:complete len:236 (-),score=98.00 NODE_13098_length_1185_cov_3.969754:452-1159(-)